MKYYLEQNGSITGPYSDLQIAEFKLSKKIGQYHWIIDSDSKTWKYIHEVPNENPFNLSEEPAMNRRLSAAFIFFQNPFVGEVFRIHSSNLEMLIRNRNSPIRGLSLKSRIRLNFCDETNLVFKNSAATIESQEVLEDGLHIKIIFEDKEMAS